MFDIVYSIKQCDSLNMKYFLKVCQRTSIFGAVICGCSDAIIREEFELVGVVRWIEGGIEQTYNPNCSIVIFAHDHELSRIVETEMAWKIEACSLAQPIDRLKFKWHRVVCQNTSPASQCCGVIPLDQAEAMIGSICNYDVIVSVHNNVHGEKKPCNIEMAITKANSVLVVASNSFVTDRMIVIISNNQIIVIVDEQTNRTVKGTYFRGPVNVAQHTFATVFGHLGLIVGNF